MAANVPRFTGSSLVAEGALPQVYFTGSPTRSEGAKPLRGHPYAYAAARAAECAGEQGSFWPVHDLLFERRDEWAGPRDEQAFVNIGREAGVEDSSEFEARLREEGAVDSMECDEALGAELGVRGTPTFIVNGQVHIGTLDSLRFASVHEELLRADSR